MRFPSQCNGEIYATHWALADNEVPAFYKKQEEDRSIEKSHITINLYGIPYTLSVAG